MSSHATDLAVYAKLSSSLPRLWRRPYVFMLSVRPAVMLLPQYLRYALTDFYQSSASSALLDKITKMKNKLIMFGAGG